MADWPAVIHGCTVTAQNYLPHARVLAESFLASNPGSSFSALIVDDPPGGPPRENESFESLAPADIGVSGDELYARATMYGTQGLAASMKPDLLLELLTRGWDAVVLIDADGCVYGEIAILAELARSHSLVLSPHMLDPHPLSGGMVPEEIVMRAGVMNAGLLAVGASARRFLGWWSDRIRHRCVFDESLGLALGQTWLTVAVSLFEHHVLRDRGCNVAGWNLRDRDIRWDGGEPRIDGVPLLHFHFAGGFDPERPHLLSPSEHNKRWWPKLDERPGVARLAREYAQALIDRGYRDEHAVPCRYEFAPDGTQIEPWMRSIYRVALMRAEYGACATPPNPFADGPEAFFGWLRERLRETAVVTGSRPAGE